MSAPLTLASLPRRVVVAGTDDMVVQVKRYAWDNDIIHLADFALFIGGNNVEARRALKVAVEAGFLERISPRVWGRAGRITAEQRQLYKYVPPSKKAAREEA